MKKLLLIGVLSCLFISCNPICNEDSEFKEFYCNKLDSISEYGKLFDTDSAVILSEERWHRFLDISEYLKLLTSYELNYKIIEAPIYENQTLLESDICYLEHWYNDNKCGMTIAKADSIVSIRRKRLKGN
ncbi:MAG: hypothetical protein IPH84_10555 [Bacteroidales bacterium]|nr:hypothetical protein [Bacteroidales bacterium]